MATWWPPCLSTSSPLQLSNPHAKMVRTPSLPLSEDAPSKQKSSSLPRQSPLDTELSIPPKKSSVSRTHKEKGAFHLLGTAASSQTNKPAEGHSQVPNRLFGLAKSKDKKEKKKKGKGPRSQPSGKQNALVCPSPT